MMEEGTLFEKGMRIRPPPRGGSCVPFRRSIVAGAPHSLLRSLGRSLLDTRRSTITCYF